MNGASLIAKNLPLQDQFNIIEDLMLAFCEKVALPCFLCRDANPDLYSWKILTRLGRSPIYRIL